MKYALPLIAILALGSPGAEAAITVAPHRAIYDLTLLRTGNDSNLQSATGRLAFEIQGSSCEGYTVSFRMVTKYSNDGVASMIDSQSTTYEGPGALDFRYQLKELMNGEVKDETKLKVTKPAPDQEGKGEITSKGNESFTLAGDVFLPMQHQLKLMALGEAGGGRDSSRVFDGSDGGTTFQVVSFVGKTKPPGSISRDAADPVAAPLKLVAAWPMTISYFSAEKGESTPEYQVSFNLYENGVATGVVLDYGKFALAGKLADLTMFEASECP